MKDSFLFRFPFILVLATFTISSSSQILFWDPNGATPGTSVSGPWNITTPNWTTLVDSGTQTTWAQGSEADFGVTSDYAITLTEPISLGNLTATGSVGTLTIAGDSINLLTLANSSIFNTSAKSLLVSAPITGTFDLTKSGAGTLALSGPNTFSGGVNLNAGTVALGIDSAYSGSVTSGPLGTGSLTVLAPGVLSAFGGARFLDNPVTLSANLAIAGTNALVFRNGAFLVAGANRTLTVTNTADTTITANLADDGTGHTLTKAGSGRLILSGDNSGFIGPITISAGTLMAGSDTAIRASAVLTATGTLNMNNHNGSVVGLAGAGFVNLGSGTLTISNMTTSRNFTGVISGSGGLVIADGVSQQIEGNNTFSGGILIKFGTLFLRTNNATSSGISQAAGTGTITLEDTGLTPRPAVGANYTAGVVHITNSIFCKAGRGLFFPSNGGTNQFDGVFSGPGGLLRDNNGSGLVMLTGDNTFAGGLEIDSRTLALGHRNSLGTGLFTIGNPLTTPPTTINIAAMIDLTGTNALPNATAINQSFTISGTNNLEIAGPVTLSNFFYTTIAGPGALRFSGSVDGAFGFAKAGNGTLDLAGANTFSGDITVVAGTLLANNTSGFACSNVVIQGGAVLGGRGTLSGAVTSSGGAIVAPGNSAGKLTIANGLDLSAGATVLWELAAPHDSNSGVAGSDFDQIAVTGGNLALGPSTELNLTFTNAASFPDATNGFWQTSHSWKIISLSGLATNSGNSNFGLLSGTNGVTAGTFFTSVDSSGSILLSYSSFTVPRPVIEKTITGAGTTNALIRWSAVNGTTYQVQYKTNLDDSSWSVLGSPITATGPTASTVDSTSPPATQRFYRVVVQ